MVNPIFLKIGRLTIRWYGIIATLATLASFLYFKKSRQFLKIKTDLDNLFIATVVVGILGARLYHVLNELPWYLQHPSLIPAIWHGGLAWHGGVIAGFIVIFYYAQRHKLAFLTLADLFAPTLLLALALGRWGNFFNQELFGQPTQLPWGIFIALHNRPPNFTNFTHFHPVFLYESLWCLIGITVITIWLKQKPPQKPGLIFSVSLILLGLGRLLVELLRIDLVPLIFGIRLPLLVSGVIVIVGLVSLLLLVASSQFKFFLKRF